MIVWQGFGFLGVLIPILSYMLTVKMFQGALGVPFTDTHSWPGALGTLIGAGLVWLIARMLNSPGRTLIDPVTGETVVLRKKHTFFFVPINYIAAVMAVVAIGMLFFKDGSPL